MKQIPLTQDKMALVDDEDFKTVARFKWCATYDRGRWYAIRFGPRSDKPRKKFWMHRVICNVPIGILVDHKDGDGLNNQKNNLRSATRNQNQYNSGKRSRHPSSSFKGVCRFRGRWMVRIRYLGQNHYLGIFTTDEEAAKVYDRAALLYHGEFAKLNFWEDIYESK